MILAALLIGFAVGMIVGFVLCDTTQLAPEPEPLSLNFYRAAGSGESEDYDGSAHILKP